MEPAITNLPAHWCFAPSDSRNYLQKISLPVSGALVVYLFHVLVIISWNSLLPICWQIGAILHNVLVITYSNSRY